MEIQSESDFDAHASIENTETFSRVAAAVCEQIRSRRIGFLWPGAPCDIPCAPGFTWVHYAPGARGARRYDLDALARPDLEARGLRMLVVPAGAVSLLAELASGILLSPASAMIDGALRGSVPVLFETSEILSWYASAAEAARRSLCKAVGAMRGRGMEFLGFTLPPAPEEPLPGGTEAVCEICESGWHAWADIAGRLAGARVLRLASGARLTPEAQDRLANLKIRIIWEDV